jgi:hypothetical protein
MATSGTVISGICIPAVTFAICEGAHFFSAVVSAEEGKVYVLDGVGIERLAESQRRLFVDAASAVHCALALLVAAAAESPQKCLWTVGLIQDAVGGRRHQAFGQMTVDLPDGCEASYQHLSLERVCGSRRVPRQTDSFSCGALAVATITRITRQRSRHQ